MWYRQQQYITLVAWHRGQGSRLQPPVWRPPGRLYRRAQQDTGYDDWIQQVRDYLVGLDQETQQALRRLPAPVRVLGAIADQFDAAWFRADKLRRLVDAREQLVQHLDKQVNALSTNLAISNQYLDAVLETSDRIQSQVAQKAANAILDLTHADQVTA